MAPDHETSAGRPGTVRVRGTASRWVPADVADVTFTVTRTARTTGEAVTDAGIAQAALDAALEPHDAVIVRRSTAVVSVREQVRYEPKSGREIREGFVATRVTAVRFRAVSEAGDALRSVVAAVPELRVDGPALALEPTNPAHSEVRADAAAAARSSADAYARGVGLTLGRVLRLREPDTEVDGHFPAQGGGFKMRAMVASAAPDGGESVLVDLGPEDVEIEATIELTVTLV